MKAINSHTSNEFHVWQPRLYPSGLRMQDVDAWAIAVSEPPPSYRVVALFELKRSSIDVAAWRPFDADRPTYAALLDLAERAGVPLFVVYFQKGVPIQDETRLHVFRLEAAVPEYHGRRIVLTARQFAARFPDLCERQVPA